MNHATTRFRFTRPRLSTRLTPALASLLLLATAQSVHAQAAPPPAITSTLVRIPKVPVVHSDDAENLDAACKKLVPVKDLLGKAAPAALGADAKENALTTAANAAVLLLQRVEPACEHLFDPAPWPRLSQSDIDAVIELLKQPNLASIVNAIGNVDSRLATDDLFAQIKRNLSANNSTQGGLGIPNPLTGLESTLINGLADFLVTRAKAEAIAYLREQITERFCSKASKENLSLYLPNLCETLQHLDESMSIAATGTVLNAAARRDLEGMPDALLVQIGAKDPAHLFVYEPSRLSYAAFRAAQAGRSPIEIFRSLHATKQFKCEAGAASDQCRTILWAFRMASALLYSVDACGLSGTAAQGKLSGMQAVAAVLLAQNNLKPFNDLPLGVGGVRALMRIVAGVGLTLSDWNLNVNPLFTKKASAAGAASPTSAKTAADVRRDVASSISKIALDCSQLARSVTSAVATAADAASLDKGYDRAEVAIAIGTDLINEQYGALVTDTSRLFVQLRTDDPELEDLFHVAARIGPLVAELAGAKSSKDVATVLEAAAAPVGSYKAKYQRAGMSLNSFVGVAGGGEVMQVPAVAGTGATSSTSASFGGFVPVGLHATAPFCAAASGGNWFHIGATLSLIDLGALSTVRFKNDVSGSRAVSQTTSSAPNVGVGQIFAPGFYLTLGLFKSPIVVGAGGSLGPSLRTVNSTDANGIERTDKTSVFRFGGFLALDLTLMPF